MCFHFHSRVRHDAGVAGHELPGFRRRPLPARKSAVYRGSPPGPDARTSGARPTATPTHLGVARAASGTPASQTQKRDREEIFESRRASRTDLLTRFGGSPAPGRIHALEREKRLAGTQPGFLRDRERRTGRRRNGLLCWGYCEGRTGGAGVNQQALNFRIKTIWLPECNTNPNTVVESPTGARISTLLTELDDVESKGEPLHRSATATTLAAPGCFSFFEQQRYR